MSPSAAHLTLHVETGLREHTRQCSHRDYVSLLMAEEHLTALLCVVLVKSIRSTAAYLAETLYYAMKVSGPREPSV